MLIRLDKITDEPFVWHEKLTVPLASLDRSELVSLGEIAWQGSVSIVPNGFHLAARLGYDQELSCGRCLKRIVQHVESDVELMIAVGVPEPTAGEHELSESDLSVMFVAGDELDTRPILLEQLQLNVPMRALCRDDCAGLCPVCGEDRNRTACGCQTGVTDPRWDALKGWSGSR